MDQKPNGRAAVIAGLSQIATPVLSLLMFLALFFLPIMGLALNFLAPLPLIYYFYTHGRAAFGMAVVAIAVIISFTLGVRLGVFYLITYALLAYLIAEMILRKETMAKIILVSAFIPLTAMFAFFLLFSAEPLWEMHATLLAKAMEAMNDIVTSSVKAGMPQEQAQYLIQNAEELSRWGIKLMPGTSAVLYMLLAYGNFIAYRRIREKYQALPEADPIKVSQWSPPEKMVLPLIASLFLLMVAPSPMDAIGGNLLIVTLAIYVLAGIAVMEFFTEKFKVPFFLRLVAYTLIIVQPFFLSMVAGIGLFDLWLDFRKIRKNEDKKDESEDK